VTVERFDHYIERCLYHPELGFYASGEGRAGGAHGDFITSPEVGPLFGEVLSRALDSWWAELGQPDPFSIYDIGTGPGSLVRSLAAAPGPSAAARQVVGLDRTAPEQTAPDLAGAVVIANELLDNLPFRVVERGSNGWSELYVAIDDDGNSSETMLSGPDPGLDVPLGVRVPWLEQAGLWVAQVLAQRPAVLVVFDYGAITTAELAVRGGWLRTYRRHQRGHDPLVEPGSWDITSDIAVDQLPGSPQVVDQATFLRQWGIEELVAEGRRYWIANAARPDVAAFKMRSRISEAEALLDPAGLGRWLACTWRP
jgi:SAM-dependent MidA family methyltransferase